MSDHVLIAAAGIILMGTLGIIGIIILEIVERCFPDEEEAE